MRKATTLMTNNSAISAEFDRKRCRCDDKKHRVVRGYDQGMELHDQPNTQNLKKLGLTRNQSSSENQFTTPRPSEIPRRSFPMLFPAKVSSVASSSLLFLQFMLSCSRSPPAGYSAAGGATLRREHSGLCGLKGAQQQHSLERPADVSHVR